MNTKPTESYTSAVWDYLRGLRPTEPGPSVYGLDEDVARVIRRQCQLCFEQWAKKSQY